MLSKRMIQFLALFVVGLCVIVFTRHDAFLYRGTVAQVTAAKTIGRQKNVDGHQNVDHTVTQRLTLKILNKSSKQSVIHVHNSYTDSQAVDQPYRPGQQVMITLSKKPQDVVIKGLKRDTMIVTLVVLVMILILLIVRKRGLLAVASLIVNILLFILAIQLELVHNGKHLLPIFALLAVLFTIFTLSLIFGLNRQMIITASATLISTFVSFALFLAVLHLTKEQGIHYEAVSYAVQQPRTIFLAQVMIGALGAIMDETADITSAMHQLKLENPAFKFWPVFKSGLNMGRQIIGPLISILFLIFMADTIPMAVLYLRNGNSIAETFNWTMYLGLTQSLVSAIGITVAVPLTSALAGQLLGGSAHGRRD